MRNLKNFIKSDLHRYTGKEDFKSFIKTYLTTAGFNYLVWFRITQKYNNIFTRFLLKRKMIKFGNEKTIIGNNCNISQGVTIGQINRGEKQGTPTIEDEVYIGPGAKIIGKINIGHHSAIGANAVVIKDVLPNTTVGGIPAKQISNVGSEGYVNRVCLYQ